MVLTTDLDMLAHASQGTAKFLSLVLTMTVGVSSFAATQPSAQSYNILRSFGGVENDGSIPFGSLTIDGSALYGMTPYGGASGAGLIFTMNTDGTGFSTLHSFTDAANDGGFPYAGLTLSGATLYGLTSEGGNNDYGAVFKINRDGSGFSLLHSLAGQTDGSYPECDLTLSGSTLFGVTPFGGGATDSGTVFKMNTDSTGFAVLHEFTGGTNDGRKGWGTLSLSGATLYGMTSRGGSNNVGVLFSMNADGSGFNLLHDFKGGSDDGSLPFGSLTLAGSKIYGMTFHGGKGNNGVIFQINTDGSDFTLLHEFSGGPEDGALPDGSLTLVGSTLYGMTERGGDADVGVLFQIHTNGTGFALLHEFGDGPRDGTEPNGDLISDGSILYGMTPFGGEFGEGTVFAYQIPEPNSGLLTGLALLLVARRIVRSEKREEGS